MTNSDLTPYVYKIFRQKEWAELKTAGTFTGSKHDQRDGFIHLSLAAQVQGTLDKHYTIESTGGEPLILAQIDEANLGQSLKYEISRGGDKFPHLYDILRTEQINTHWVLPADSAGRYASETFLTEV